MVNFQPEWMASFTRISITKEFINQIEGKYLEVKEITDLLKEVVSQKESEKLKNKDISTPPSQSETDQV